MTSKKNFTMIDEAFICQVCKREVEVLGYTARDHCPYCLHSLHLDIMPGDRQSSCHGILVPEAIERMPKDNYKIIYRCFNCGEIKKNKAAKDDNFDLILALSVQK